MSSTATSQLTKSAVTLKGSAQMVAKFFDFGINSILYQRGIYPPESFVRKQEYGLTLLVSEDEKVKDFLKNVLSQIEGWLNERKVKKLVVVLTNVDTKEVLERWEFKIEYETENQDGGVKDENCQENGQNKKMKEVSEKDEKVIKQEIRDVIRQITASVTFLPLLDCVCSFDILIHTHKDTDVPDTWDESEEQLIKNSEEVKLRSFSTGIHKLEAAVSYRADL